MSAALDTIAERAADVRRAFTPGALPRHDDVATPAAQSRFTLDPLAAGAPEGAYFMSADARGRTGYTRDGTFRLAGGKLTDASGCAVLGRRSPDAPLRELRVDPVDAALGRVADPRIEADGTFAYTRAAVDPRTGERAARTVVVGKLALARFPAGTRFDTGDGRRFSAPPGVTPHTGSAGDGSFGAVTPMRSELSRVDLDRGLARLKEAYVAFDALAAAEAAKDRFGKTAMDVVK